MSFNILAVREGDAGDDPLYPRPGQQPNSVESSQTDGHCLPPITATELTIREILPSGSSKRLLRLQDIKAQLVVTESRVTVACSKYDKGGGWRPWSLGAIPVAVATNAVSKARASRRRQGKMLVGQVPYKRLLNVGYKPRGTPLGHDQLRVGTLDPTIQTFRGLTLDVSLSRQVSAADTAQQIATLAATYRLNSGEEIDETLRELLTDLRSPAPPQPVRRQFVSYVLVQSN